MVHYGKGGDGMLRIDEQKAVREKVRERAKLLPEPVRAFLSHIEETRSIATTYEYAKDLHLFCGFLMEGKTREKNLVANAPINMVEKHQVDSFMVYLTAYERTFETAAGNEVVQRFENTIDGKNRKLATLKAYYAFAFSRGLTVTNFSDDLDLWKDTTTPSRDFLLESDFTQLLETIMTPTSSERGAAYHELVATRDRAICTLLFYLGLKVSEVTNLNMAHIFPEDGVIAVRRRNQPLAYMTLEGKAFRFVLDYYEERLASGNQTDGEDPLFLSMQQKRINARTIRLFLSKYQERTGITLHITPQVLRKSYANYHYHIHHDLPLLAQSLGHKNVEPIIRYYFNPERF